MWDRAVAHLVGLIGANLKRLTRNDDFRKKVTSVIKRLKGYRNQGNVLEGVTVNKSITVKKHLHISKWWQK